MSKKELKMDRSNHKFLSLSNIPMLILYISFLALLIRAVDKKINYHMDEIYSYGYANHQEGTKPKITDGQTYSPSESVYLKYMTVDEHHRFDYKNVWKNQSQNDHPPLFFILVHTVCSFFPGSFSKWYAASINILFLLITLYITGKISELISGGDRIIKFLISLLFIISVGVISSGTFLRMYCMAMCWNTMLCWLLLRESSKESPGLNFYASLFLTAFLGVMTHYYCIVFTVLSCAVYTVFLLIRRRYRTVLQLILTGIVSALTICAVWPYIIKHIFSSSRGVQSVENLTESFDAYLPKLSKYWLILIRDLFGGRKEFLIVPLGLVILFFIFSKFFGMKDQDISGGPVNVPSALNTERFLILWLPVIAYFLLIAKIAPYQTARYIFPVYALTLVGVFCFFFTALKRIPVKYANIILSCICLMTLAYFEWKKPVFPHQYLDTYEILEKAEMHQNSNCIYVYQNKKIWRTYASFLEVSKYKSVTFFSDMNMDLIDNMEFDNDQELVVFVDNYSSELIEKVTNHFPNLIDFEELGTHGYSTSYVFHLDGK